MLLAAAASLGVAGLPRTVASTSAHVETRLRHPAIAGSTERRPAWDLDASALGGLSLTWPRARLDFAYTPRFTLTDITGVFARDLLNSASLGFSWRSRRFSLGIVESASYGTRWYSLASRPDADPITGMPVIQPVYGASSVLYASTLSALTARYTLARSLDVQGQVAYGISGGADDESRRIVPLTSGPSAALLFEWRASRTDSFGPQVNASYRRTLLGGTTSPVVTANTALMGFWSHRWSRQATSTLSGGAAYVRQFEPVERKGVYPQAAGGFSYTTPFGSDRGMLTLSANAGLMSMVSPLTGAAQQTVTASVVAQWTRRRLGLRGSLGLFMPVGERTTTAATSVFVEAGTVYAITRALSWNTGVRLGTQVISGASTTATRVAPAGTQISFFTGLTLTPPVIPL